MNYKLVLSVLGKVMITLAILLLCPLCVGLIYREMDKIVAFAIPCLILIVLGIPLSLIRDKNKLFYAKEGFVIVSLSWIIVSLFGALPFTISGEIPYYIDAFFETVSGFSTTGASILDNVEVLSKSIQFWRVLTHFIGGMGVLVFVLAMLPEESGAMHIFRAESPGPSSSKFVSKIRHTARILYLIYIVLTFIEIIFMLCGGLSLYDSILVSFSTAGTGGFSNYSDSIAHFNSTYVEVVVATFMLLFGVNFNVFYLILTGNVAKALKSEEFISYILILTTSILIIAINLLSQGIDFANGLRLAFFQTTSISSTTGYVTADFISWPTLSKSILLILTLIGACGGSTGGGLKVSRFVILIKSASAHLKRAVNPRSVVPVKFEGKPLAKQTESGVRTFLLLYIFLVILSTLLLSFDNILGDDAILTNLSASLTCISNVGPGMTNLIGPLGSFAVYSPLSKILLSFLMLVGRLEIFPMLLLFAPRTWKK